MSAPPRFARLSRVVAALLVAGFLGYGILDFTLQTLEKIPPRRRLPRDWASFESGFTQPEAHVLQFHPRWLWELRPNANFKGLEINEYGLRGPSVAPASDGRFRIAVLGGSGTFCFNLGGGETETWPRILERILRTHGLAVDVLNFGIPCHSAVQSVEWFKGRGRQWKPDVVVAVFGAFDECSVASEYGTDRDWMAKAGTLSYRASQFFERFGTLRYLGNLFSGSEPPKPASGAVRVPLDQYEAALRELIRLQREDGRAIGFVLPPRRGGVPQKRPQVVEYDLATGGMALAENVPILDVGAYFRWRSGGAGRIPDGEVILEDFLFSDRTHPSLGGCVQWAQFLSAELDRSGLLKGVPRER